jgi:hypothetical protein
VPVNVQLQALGALNLSKEGSQGRCFWGAAGRSASVVLSTRVCRGATADIPLERPVTVDVVAKARTTRSGLTVLAPQAVIGLGIQES